MMRCSGVFVVTAVASLLPNYVSAQSACLERLKPTFDETSYISDFQPEGRVDVEQTRDEILHTDIVRLMPGHKVTISVSGSIDVHRQYWEERKCKYFGLKCWYEPRESHNWQDIGARPIEYGLCSFQFKGRDEKCDLGKINASAYTGLSVEGTKLALPTAITFETLTNKGEGFQLGGRIEGEINRSHCTGARPSTCSFGTYSFSTIVDVKPRVVGIQTLLERPLDPAKIVGDRLIDKFIERSESGRKVAACLVFNHVQKYFGSDSPDRENLLRYVVRLDPHLEYRVALTSLLISTGAIDEALGDSDEILGAARKAYVAARGAATGNIYAEALLNRARLWVEDRVATEGADLEIAVGLFDELTEVRHALLMENRASPELLRAFVEGQVEQARLMSMIRTGPMLEQAEASLVKALSWTPLRYAGEAGGESVGHGVRAAFVAEPGHLALAKQLKETDTAGDATAARGRMALLRLPSWSAKVLPFASPDGQASVIGLMDQSLEQRLAIWLPGSGEPPRDLAHFAGAASCPSAPRFVGGWSDDDSLEKFAFVVYLVDASNDLWAFDAAAGTCTKVTGGIPTPDPDDPELISVSSTGDLIFAVSQSLYKADRTGAGILVRAFEGEAAVLSVVAASGQQESFAAITTKNEQDLLSLYHQSTGAAQSSEEKPIQQGLRQEQRPVVVGLTASKILLRRGSMIHFLDLADLRNNSSLLSSDVAIPAVFELPAETVERLGASMVGDEFVLAVLQDDDPTSIGSSRGIIVAMINSEVHIGAVSPEDGAGFRPYVWFDKPASDAFEVGLLAGGVSGKVRIFTSATAESKQVGESDAAATTSDQVAILENSGLVLTTRISAGSDASSVRNVPAFNGHEIAELSKLCREKSSWGCRALPLGTEPDRSGPPFAACMTGVADMVLLVTVGGKAKSDGAIVAKIACGAQGLPELMSWVDRTSLLAPVNELQSSQGPAYSGPKWRYVGPRGAVGPLMERALFAALPTEPADPEYSGPSEEVFSSLASYQIPVRSISADGAIQGTAELRSPFGIRMLLANIDSTKTTISKVYALSDRADSVIAYAGDARGALEWAKITPGTLTQSVIAQNGADALLVSSDVTGTSAGMWIIRDSESNDEFGISGQIQIDPSSLLADWTLEVRRRLHMRFRLIDGNRDLSFFWMPSGHCSVLRRSDQPSVDILTWNVGVPVGFANLFDSAGSRIGNDLTSTLQREIPITIQRPRMTLPIEPTIPSGSPYTEHWRTVHDGAGCA